MSTSLIIRIGIISSILLFASTPYVVVYGASQEDLKFAIDQKARELDEITRKIQETQISLTEESVRSSNLKTEIKRIENTAKSVDLGIRASELTIDKLTLEISSVQHDITQGEASLLAKREAIATLLQNVQQRGEVGLLTMFMQEKTLAESIAETQTIDDVSAGLLEQLEEIRRLKSQLTDHLDTVAQKKRSVELERSSLTAKRSIVEDQKAERQRLLSETQNKQEVYQKVISDLEKKQQSISDEIDAIEDKLRAEFGSAELPRTRPGVFVEPINGGRISQAYGKTPSACKLYKKTCFHNGIDYAVSIGTPVLAADDGVILMAGNNGRVQYGKYIAITHQNGLTTLYAHLSRQSVKTGESVKRGQIIGYSGNTGYSTGAHLHFMVYLSSSVQLKAIGGAGVIPVGYTLDPASYL